MDQEVKSGSVVDTIYNVSKGFYTSTNPNLDYGQVNEITPEEQKRRRNRQLAISLIVVVAVGVIYYFYTRKNK